MTAAFRGIRPGDRVLFRDRFGKVRGGRAVRFLIFSTHAVVDIGRGQPQVVTASNYVARKGS